MKYLHVLVPAVVIAIIVIAHCLDKPSSNLCLIQRIPDGIPYYLPMQAYKGSVLYLQDETTNFVPHQVLQAYNCNYNVLQPVVGDTTAWVFLPGEKKIGELVYHEGLRYRIILLKKSKQ